MTKTIIGIKKVSLRINTPKWQMALIFFAIATLLFTGCKNEKGGLGAVIQPEEDMMIVAADTFIIESTNYCVPAISAQSDTMIIGEFFSPKYGPTKADLMIQIAPPAGYEFPGEEYRPTPDSLILTMFYNTWMGSPYAPLEFSIYEMNQERVEYSKQYLSNFEPGQFTDSTILMGKRLVTTIDLSRRDSLHEDTAEVPFIRYKFDDEQLQRFWNLPSEAYASEDRFLDEFKGMYITTRYGQSTLIYLNQITMFLYYHYTYNRGGIDTVVNTSITFPANKEVRQLNRYYHHNIDQYATCPDSINYIKSTAGIYPKIQLPLGKINQRIKERIGKRDLNINGAEIDIEAIDFDSEEVYMDPPTYLLALTFEEFDDFIKHNTPPTAVDTTQAMASYSVLTHSYSLDIKYLLTKYLRHDISPDENLELILIPVDIEGTMSNISRIKPLTKLSAITIRSGKNEYSPMRLKVLYNGF